MPSVERSLRVEAVVIRHSDWGEADRMLVLYSREHGKLRAIAKGVRKMRSRKAGHLEPLTRVSLQLARGRDLLIVTQAETMDAYMPLRDDLMHTTYAAGVLELVDRFTIEDDPNHALYQLLTDTLGRISSEPQALPVVLYFQMRLVDLMGFRPDLFHCIGCREEIQAEDQFFSPGQGGVFCPRCGVGVPGVRPVSMNALKYLRHFQRSNYLTARRAAISEEVLREMDSLMQDYLTYTLERKLNVPEFMRQVRG